MKAVRISDYGAPLHIDEVPVPTPGPGQILVEVEFTTMNGVDPGRGMGYLRQVFQLTFPWTPGGDVAGRVAAVAEGVVGFQVGDEVFGYTREAGAYAEFVLLEAGSLAKRPASFTAEQAASVALVGQTATQSLQLAKLEQGQTLLVMGASGGVGTLLIQLARLAGVHTTVTARSGKADELRALGAERVIDTDEEKLEDQGQFDAVINLIGGDTVASSYTLVKRGGVAVTANRPPIKEEADRLGIDAVFVETNVTTDGLNKFAALVTEGKVRPVIALTTTLWSPDSLWEKHATDRPGKIVFSVKP